MINEAVATLARDLKADKQSNSQIADVLNAQGHTNARGKPFNTQNVATLLAKKPTAKRANATKHAATMAVSNGIAAVDKHESTIHKAIEVLQQKGVSGSSRIEFARAILG